MIDLEQRVIEIYRRPSAAGYQEKNTPAADDRIAPLALPDVGLAVAEILDATA